jgi:phosphorylase superfamily protein
MTANRGGVPPILTQKHYSTPSAFTPESLLREARRQKRIAEANIPAICILDPDGDMLRHLIAGGEAWVDPAWACYHKLLISVTSSGQIVPIRPPPYFILIDRALRDEGTSYHYMAASEYSHASAALIAALDRAFDKLSVPVLTGATWTTDAPFRETQPAIDAMREKNLMAVEMEAAALYAFAQVRQKPVLCFAHVTNQMGRIDGDFEKGEAAGSKDALDLVTIVADRLRPKLQP